jgi:hypothetical protein
VEAQLKSKFWAVGVTCFLLFCIAPASALASSISGTLTDAESGLPVSEFMACAESSSTRFCFAASESGEYTVSGLPADEYLVEFRPQGETASLERNYVARYWQGTSRREDATLVQLGEEDERTGIDGEVEVGGEVAGTVVAAGDAGPIEGASVCAQEVDPAGEPLCGYTDEQGEYAIHGLAPGIAYTLSFEESWGEVEYAPRYYDEKSRFDEAETIELGGGESLTANAVMTPAGAIEGTLTGEGEPLFFGEICAYTLDHQRVDCESSDETGEYELWSLAEGSYIIKFAYGGYSTRYSGGATDFAEATPVMVHGGETLTLDQDLTALSGITGTVVDAETGQPIDGAQACATPISGSGGSDCWEVQEGRYRIESLEPGTYEVQVSDNGYLTQYYDGVVNPAEETPVIVGESMVSGIDFELARAGSIEGHVTLASSGTSLGSVNVCALGQSGTAVGCELSNSSSGKYTIRELPPGEYKVRFTKSSYGTQYYNGKATITEADPVTVTGGQTTEGIDAAMVAVPKNTTKPQLSGVGRVGEVLSCSQGTWTGSPTLYEYFWFRGIEELEGEEASTYTLAPADAGKTIRCGVVAENSGGWSFAESSNFLKIPSARQLSVSKGGSGSGTVTSNPAGIECGQTCSFGAYQGDQFTLTATPAAHSEFTGWSGVCSGAGTCEVTLGFANASVSATFAPITHPVSVQVTGSGSVAADSGAISGCTEAGGTCLGTYDEGTEVTLTATPDAHRELTGWTGCTTQTGDECKVTVEAAEGVTATFAPITHLLSVSKSGDGSGTVTSSPTGTECGANCIAGFEEGTAITLTATPGAHSEFEGWSGGGCSGTQPCTVTLGSDTPVTAEFAKVTHGVSVAVTGAGSVTADAGAISGCTGSGGTCAGTYDEGSEVTLTATPDPHHAFTGWTGCTTQSGTECKVTVEAAESVTAAFAPIVDQLSVTKTGDGSGTVTSSPTGIDCGASCAAGFEEGTAITLTAVADPGSEFTGWSGGGCSGTGTCSVTLGEDTSVVAGFAKKASPPLPDGSSISTPPASTPPVTSPPPSKHVTKKKPLQCKKGFHKVKQKGKARCLKVKPKQKGKRG